MNSRNKKQIVVVVHDAGGAEVIGAYIRTRVDTETFHAYGAGPAARVFKRLGIPLQKIRDDVKAIERVMARHTGASYALIAAPGWMTQIEIRALRAAKKAGIKTVVYMDSWTDERKRFGYPEKGWQAHEPDAFWVGDAYARENIRRQFPHVPVRLVPNRYFVDEKKRFKELKRSAAKPTAILFVSIPSGKSHELLAELLHLMSDRKSGLLLRIRFHPGDHQGRYDALIGEFHDRVMIEKSREQDLVKDLLSARAVIGTETMALVISMLCGIATINYVPAGTHSIIPFSQITRTANIRSAALSALEAAASKS